MTASLVQPSDSADSGFQALIRPGVVFPNWSAVASPQARRALDAIFDAFGIEKCWRDYGEAEDRVRRAILESYAETGRAPAVADLANVVALPENDVRRLIASLKKRDLVVLDEAGQNVTGAYPLTDRPTDHGVTIGDVTVNAMCAVDALGTGAMYGRDTTINSRCRACGEPLRIVTRDGGTALGAVSSADIVVWSGIEYEDDSAATSLCTVIAFFCGDDHLRSWCDANYPATNGFRLSPDEALQVGMAIFTPMLTPASPTLQAAHVSSQE